MRPLVHSRTLIEAGVLAAMAFIATPPPVASGQASSELGVIHPDSLRMSFVTTSNRFRVALSRHPELTSLNQGRPVWLLTDDEIIASLDSVFLKLYGVPFLTDNEFTISVIDSLRLQFYDTPGYFDDDRIDHLEAISKIASAEPFARGNAELIEMLRVDREEYFDDPGSYTAKRLDELDGVSMRATSLPFVRGSPDLVAKLENARMEYERVSEIYPTERLAELDDVSLQVMGSPFVETVDYRSRVVVAVIGLGLLVLIIWISHRRSGPLTQPPQEAPNENVMSVAQACLILGVEPDCDLQTLSRAYRNQQKKYHPDLVAHLGTEFAELAEKRTRSINQAYSLLSDRLA